MEYNALRKALTQFPDEEADFIKLVADLLAEAWQMGYIHGQSLDAKTSFWTGVKTGIIRHSWIQESERYVGPVASPDSRLSLVLKKVDEESRQED